MNGPCRLVWSAGQVYRFLAERMDIHLVLDQAEPLRAQLERDLGGGPPDSLGTVPSQFNIAQVNIALSRAPIDSSLLSEFVALLDPINQLADQSAGFVWRLQTEDGNATGIRAFDDERLIINMSVWESIEQLAQFVYRSAHVGVVRRRREWFEHIRVYSTLWWVPLDHVPTVSEAELRLAHLRESGPTPFAFTFKRRFPAPDADIEPWVEEDMLGCPA